MPPPWLCPISHKHNGCTLEQACQETHRRIWKDCVTFHCTVGAIPNGCSLLPSCRLPAFAWTCPNPCSDVHVYYMPSSSQVCTWTGLLSSRYACQPAITRHEPPALPSTSPYTSWAFTYGTLANRQICLQWAITRQHARNSASHVGRTFYCVGHQGAAAIRPLTLLVGLNRRGYPSQPASKFQV